MTDPITTNPTGDQPDLAQLPFFLEPLEPSRMQLRFDAVSADRLPPDLRPSSASTTAAVGRRAVTAGLRADDPGELDWPLVRHLREQAAARLTEAQITATQNHDAIDERDVGEKVVDELLQEHANQVLYNGTEPAMSLSVQQRTAQAVIDALFGMGRIEPLLRRGDVENIEAIGYDQVLLDDENGELHHGPNIASSDAEMLDDLMFLASRHGRPFSEAVPALDLELEDGSRLAATAWVTPRPTLQIRRHRLRNINLQTLVDLKTLTPGLAGFLAAAVRSGRSIVVAGSQGAGKTTLVRALCAEFGQWEKVGTFETERELGLDKLDKHPRVIAWESRPGSGEFFADGREAGEVTLRTLLKRSFRYNLDRYVVGEVRGDEILEMIEAMISGQGTISTTHARNAKDILSKLVTCALKAGPNISEVYATKAISQHVDLMVFIKRDQQPLGPGETSFARRERYVTEVVASGWDKDGPNFTDIYLPGRDGRARPHVLPDDMRDLAGYGFDIDAFNQEARQ